MVVFLLFRREVLYLYLALASVVTGAACYSLCWLEKRLPYAIAAGSLCAFAYAQRAEVNDALWVLFFALMLSAWLVHWGFEALMRPWDRPSGREMPGTRPARAALFVLLLVSCVGSLPEVLARFPKVAALTGVQILVLSKIRPLMPAAFCMLMALHSGAVMTLTGSLLMLLTALPAAMDGAPELLLGRCVLVFTGCALHAASLGRRRHGLFCLIPLAAIIPSWRMFYGSLQGAQWITIEPVRELLRGGLIPCLFFGALAGLLVWLMSMLLRRHWGLSAPAWLILMALPLLFLPGLREEIVSKYFIAYFAGSYLFAWASVLLFAKS